MPSTEVQRTLVKSPPELWAELSDQASLARHLGELGEIHLTRIEPESAVEWEADNVKGSVQLKASGWGTKVTLLLTRELPEQAAAEPEVPEPEPQIAEPEPVTAHAEPVMVQPETPIAVPAPVEPNSTPEPARTRRSFFARLFRGRRKEVVAEIPEPDTVPSQPGAAPSSQPDAALAQPDAPLAQPDAIETLEPPAAETQEPQADTIEESPDLAAELAEMEQTMVEQDTALLTAVLDRLGAAHHRPFSRG
jgi:hypothetical protein